LWEKNWRGTGESKEEAFGGRSDRRARHIWGAEGRIAAGALEG
jgi:hypothetical protein